MAEPTKAVTAAAAPAAIGPYSQAVAVDGWVWCSGQVALDPATGQLVGRDAAAQTEQACRNLTAVLEAAGCGWADVVRTTIYLTDLADFAAMNEVYGRRLVAPLPARVTVQVAALPRGARVEIDAIARRASA
jgi:2-iminobutanoate/2-iminopropanoate deaminase